MPVTDKIRMPDGSEVFVWHIEETEAQLQEMYVKGVEESEQQKEVDLIKVARKRKQWYAARLLSLEVLSDFRGIYNDQFGAPHLVEDDRCVSYSHSYDKVALIVHEEHQVGIDIQKQDEKLKRISSKFLNREESKRYQDSEENLDYLHTLWSVKECVFKINKHHLPFKDICTQEVDDTNAGAIQVRAERFDGPHDHVVHFHRLKGYYLAHSCYSES